MVLVLYFRKKVSISKTAALLILIVLWCALILSGMLEPGELDDISPHHASLMPSDALRVVPHENLKVRGSSIADSKLAFSRIICEDLNPDYLLV